MTIRPSSLPMLSQCSLFEPGKTQDFTEAGTQRHEALAALFKGDATLFDALDDESQDAVKWFADLVQLHAPTSSHPLEVEVKLNPLGRDFQPLFENGGTADVVCGPVLADFKWRPRDYSAQMAAYALELFERGHKKVKVIVGYGAIKAADIYNLEEEGARELVDAIIEEAKNPNAKPHPCDYCGWCANQLTCKPYIATAKRVAAGYADEELQAKVTSWHPSEMTDPEQVALGLHIARKILGPWCESMEWHAKEMVMKRGVMLPGFEPKEKRGRQFVADVARAHELLGLEPAQLLACCDLRLNTSTKYKEKRGVIDVFAQVKELPKAAAKRQVTSLLQPVIQTTKPSVSLVEIGAKQESESE